MIPQGIISMREAKKENAHTTYFKDIIGYSYEQWVECFTAMGYYIYSISTDHNEWTIGEEILYDNKKLKKIKAFKYDGQWFAYANGQTWSAFGFIKKAPKTESGQSMIEEVPPGILKFHYPHGYTPDADKVFPYENWVRQHLKEGYTIHSISVEGKTYSVSEEILFSHNIKSPIHHFEYDGEWKIYDGPRSFDFAKDVSKLPSERKIVGWKLIQNLFVDSHLPVDFKPSEMPEIFKPIYSEPRTPVVELPDENGKMIALYTEDSFWIVIGSTYEIKEKTVALQNPKTFFTNVEFYGATEAAVIKFVRENKGVYPESLVYDLMDVAAYAAKFTYDETKEKIQGTITKLNQYKAKQ